MMMSIANDAGECDYSVLMTVMTCCVLKVLKPLDVKTKFYNTEV